jgi:hypothetical protein
LRRKRTSLTGIVVETDLGIIGAAKLAKCRRLPTVSLGRNRLQLGKPVSNFKIKTIGNSN